MGPPRGSVCCTTGDACCTPEAGFCCIKGPGNGTWYINVGIWGWYPLTVWMTADCPLALEAPVLILAPEVWASTLTRKQSNGISMSIVKKYPFSQDVLSLKGKFICTDKNNTKM